MINAPATFTSKCNESERETPTASFTREVLESDALFTILILCVDINALVITYSLISESFAHFICDVFFYIYDMPFVLRVRQ